jgi:hypothetical protein
VSDRFKMIEAKIELVLDWAEQHPEFDVEFVTSLEVQFEDRGDLSNKQVEALDNIIAKWEIDG